MKNKIVTTSWDDGHMLDLKLAELLSKYGVKGTFYISPKDKEISEDKRLTNEQIKELSNNFEIGAHTMTHPRLTALQDGEARKEIIESKKYLEQVLGKPVKSFCYPAGHYNQQHEKMTKEAGFSLARTVERFKTGVGDDPFAMPTTVHVYRHWSDAWPILRAVGFKKFLKCYFNWDELAIELFSKTPEGGVFHLWGHSWEVENNGDWIRLERVLKFISSLQDVLYRVNGELV